MCGEVFSNMALIYSALVLFGQKSDDLDVKVSHMIDLIYFNHSFSATPKLRLNHTTEDSDLSALVLYGCLATVLSYIFST